MRNITLLLLAGAVCLLAPEAPIRAEVRWVEGHVCTPGCKAAGFTAPILQNARTVYTAKGPWVDHTTRVTVSPGHGVTASPSGQRADGDNSTVNITFVATADASLGERIVSLKNAAGGEVGRMTLWVCRKGNVTGAPDLVLDEYFSTASPVVTGENIGNAAVEWIDFPTGTTGSVTSGTDTQATVKLNFPTKLAEESGMIRLYDKSCPSIAMIRMPGTYGYATARGGGWQPINIQGPNAVKAINFPVGGTCGSTCYEWGDVAKVKLNLVRPAGRRGETIWWRVDPAYNTPAPPPTVNQTVQGQSGTTYSPSAQYNSVAVFPSSSSVELSLKICQCPVKPQRIRIRTWMQSTSETGEPGYKEASFDVSCTVARSVTGDVPRCPP